MGARDWRLSVRTSCAACRLPATRCGLDDVTTTQVTGALTGNQTHHAATGSKRSSPRVWHGTSVAALLVMTRPRTWLLLMTMGILLASGAGAARADEVPLVELGGAQTLGIVEVDAPPSTVYAVVTDYQGWTEVLTDIKSVALKSGGRADARVRFASRAMKHSVTVQFTNEPDVAIRFRLVDGPSGARARGEYLLEPTDGGRRTRIRATLYMDVVGVPAWFVRDSTVRGMRQRKLRTDLLDLSRYVRSLPPPRSPS